MNTAERAAVYGTATPVPWAPWDQLDTQRVRAEVRVLVRAIHAADLRDSPARTDALGDLWAAVDSLDAFRSAIDIREAAILAVTP